MHTALSIQHPPPQGPMEGLTIDLVSHILRDVMIPREQGETWTVGRGTSALPLLATPAGCCGPPVQRARPAVGMPPPTDSEARPRQRRGRGRGNQRTETAEPGGGHRAGAQRNRADSTPAGEDALRRNEGRPPNRRRLRTPNRDEDRAQAGLDEQAPRADRVAPVLHPPTGGPEGPVRAGAGHRVPTEIQQQGQLQGNMAVLPTSLTEEQRARIAANRREATNRRARRRAEREATRENEDSATGARGTSAPTHQGSRTAQEPATRRGSTRPGSTTPRRARPPGDPEATAQRPNRRARPAPEQTQYASSPPDARDALQDIWWRHRDPEANTAPIEPADPVLAAHLAAGTWTRTSINTAVDSLARSGLVARVQPNVSPDDTRGRIRILPLTRTQLAPSDIEIAAGTSGRPQGDRPLHTVSFMDGYGTSRFAIGDLCHQMGQAHNYKSSSLIEIEGDVARRVEAYWRTPGARSTDGGPTHTVLALDVWDLYPPQRDGRSTWHRYLDTLPPGCLLLLIASSPCQDMTRASTHRGLNGLAGPRSVHFYGFAAAYVEAQDRRPDIHIQAVCEMVHPVADVHSAAMRTALGNIPVDNAVVMNAADWVACPRIRTWLATCGPTRPEHVFSYPRLRTPWETRWALLPYGATATCLRSRGDGDEILPSCYQTNVHFLLFDEDHPNRWFLCTQAQVKARLHVILQNSGAENEWPGVRAGLNLVHAGRERESPGAERAARTWARWLMRHGREHGLRPPSAEERARAVGMSTYYQGLQLQGRELYDAVGNHFDPRCLQQRVSSLLHDWFQGVDPPRAPRATFEHIRASFDRASAFARQRCPFAPRAAGPLRQDLATSRNLGSGHPVPAPTPQRP